MNLDTFYTCLSQPNARGYDLNDEQKQAVNYNDGPLWLIAGPGSGKSEVLVTRTLRLLCVEPIVEPGSILLTTFTTKASRNLEDRLATYLLALQEADPELVRVDLSDVRIGTLHSLCNDILHEYRYPNYQNVRLLDDVEQNLFIYRYSSIADYDNVRFWAEFEHSVSRWDANRNFPPNKWQRTKAATILFNRIVEDCVDLQIMESEGGHWATLVEHYRQYVQSLNDRYRCDFAHLQARFLEFLQSPASQRFFEGDGRNKPPLLHILVDEYQDTNPIQERIYLALANHPPHNLTVVGDDDQALYRFRGGNVSCMVNFNQACLSSEGFGVAPRQIPLYRNYRSHTQIVNFFNQYITSFPEMQFPGVRSPGKQAMSPESGINGSYPAIGWITTPRANDLALRVARFVKEDLLDEGIISDPSQCVLLLRSTKDSQRNAGPFIQAFQNPAINIPIYNPRSKSFMESQEVQCLLATLIHIIDFDHSYNMMRDQRGQPQFFVPTVQGWVDTLVTLAENYKILTQDLQTYVERSIEALRERCSHQPGQFLSLNLVEILHRILSLNIFQTWRQDPVRNLRLAKVTRLFESYQSFNLGMLRSSASGRSIDSSFLNRFYFMFISYLIEAGINDDEDDEVIVPSGYLPIMTIHQSKGLEFPFVIVSQLGQKSDVGSAQILERDLTPFRQDLYPRTTRTPELLAIEDDIRSLYVAYSRAEYALILAGTIPHIKNHVAAPNRDAIAFRRTIHAL